MVCRKKGKFTAGNGKTRWPITPEVHEKIRRLYAEDVGMSRAPVVREFADRHRLPAWKVKRYAQVQGGTTRGKNEPVWSEKELEIIKRSAHRSIERVQIYLKRAGFVRSVTAIALKRKRMQASRYIDGYSALQVAEAFGVDGHVVTRWVKLKYLKAMPRGTKRHGPQHGDIWYIRDAWIRAFIISCIDVIDLRKVDKYWFVDVLAGGQDGLGRFETDD